MNGLRMHHFVSVFQKIKNRGGPPMRKERKNFPRITYIRNRNFDGKNYTHFWGKINRKSAKMG